MTPFRHLLLALALDPSGRRLTSGSRLAADQALRLAAPGGARITLLHSGAPDEVWDPEGGDYALTGPGLDDEGRGVLEATTEEFRRAGLEAELLHSDESAWLAIVHRVLRGGVDLVVMGKRNESDAAGHRLGSVAMKLLRKCPCPVWVAKPGSAALPQRVLAASDLSAVGERVIEVAAFVAELFDAELHVVHSFQMPFDVQWQGGESEAAFERRERSERRQRLAEQVSETKFGGKVQYYVGLTSPTRAVLACQERIDPDLVVMGTVSRGGVAGLLVGNTAERLLGRLDCSLLTVKPDDFVCPIALDAS